MESTKEETKSDELVCLEEQNTDIIDRNTILRETILKCKEEMELNCLQKPLEDCIGRVAHYTGLSSIIINQIVSKEFNLKKKYFKLNDRKDIFSYIADLYSKNRIPTYKIIYRWYKAKNYSITFFQFQYMMSCLGFNYHKTEIGKEILMEDPSFTFERYLYLKQIKNFRSRCASIYYIDERFLDNTYNFPNPFLDNIDVSTQACNGYVFFHAISNQGFLNGLFCCPTTQTDFLKWISHILIPLLPGPSIIVINTNDLNGSLTKTITPYDSKYDMLQYLRKRNIPCNENMHKAELYQLISKCTVKQVCYEVDDIFKAHGHHVLRLPKNFHDLSLAHFMWEYLIETDANVYGNAEKSKIKCLLLDRISHLPQKLWDSFNKALVTTEEDLLKIDSKAYSALERNKFVNSL